MPRLAPGGADIGLGVAASRGRVGGGRRHDRPASAAAPAGALAGATAAAGGVGRGLPVRAGSGGPAASVAANPAIARAAGGRVAAVATVRLGGGAHRTGAGHLCLGLGCAAGRAGGPGPGLSAVSAVGDVGGADNGALSGVGEIVEGQFGLAVTADAAREGGGKAAVAPVGILDQVQLAAIGRAADRVLELAAHAGGAGGAVVPVTRRAGLGDGPRVSRAGAGGDGLRADVGGAPDPADHGALFGAAAGAAIAERGGVDVFAAGDVAGRGGRAAGRPAATVIALAAGAAGGGVLGVDGLAGRIEEGERGVSGAAGRRDTPVAAAAGAARGLLTEAEPAVARGTADRARQCGRPGRTAIAVLGVAAGAALGRGVGGRRTAGIGGSGGGGPGGVPARSGAGVAAPAGAAGDVDRGLAGALGVVSGGAGARRAARTARRIGAIGLAGSRTAGVAAGPAVGQTIGVSLARRSAVGEHGGAGRSACAALPRRAAGRARVARRAIAAGAAGAAIGQGLVGKIARRRVDRVGRTAWTAGRTRAPHAGSIPAGGPGGPVDRHDHSPPPHPRRGRALQRKAAPLMVNMAAPGQPRWRGPCSRMSQRDRGLLKRAR